MNKRDPNRQPGIYCLRSTALNRAVYVGSTTNLARRKRQHKHSSQTGVHTSNLLNVHTKEYGAGDLVFVVLDYCSTEHLDERESKFIHELGTQVSQGGLNRRVSAGSNAGMKTGIEPWNKGKSMTEEYKQRTSAATRSAMADPQIRAKMSAAKKGKPSNRLGAKTGKPAHNTKAILAKHLETGTFLRFDSIQIAAQSLNLIHGSISAVCRGQNKSLKGYTFSYL